MLYLDSPSDYVKHLKQTAHSLTKHGIPVFPCLSNKRPATINGFKDAGLDADHFDWAENFLIGVPTGLLFDVLDIDFQHGDAQAWIEQHESQIPETRIHLTRSGGFHVFFRADARVGNTTSKIGGHIDTRGRGGYIIWWAALGFSIFNPTIVAPWPEWLIPPPHEEHIPEIHHTPSNLFDVMAALDCISSDCDYQRWFEILAGVKAELGDVGLTLARDWSMTSSKYPGDAKFIRFWHSINGRGITIGTVFHYACNSNRNWKDDFMTKQFRMEFIQHGIIR